MGESIWDSWNENLEVCKYKSFIVLKGKDNPRIVEVALWSVDYEDDLDDSNLGEGSEEWWWMLVVTCKRAGEMRCACPRIVNHRDNTWHHDGKCPKSRLGPREPRKSRVGIKVQEVGLLFVAYLRGPNLLNIGNLYCQKCPSFFWNNIMQFRFQNCSTSGTGVPAHRLAYDCQNGRNC